MLVQETPLVTAPGKKGLVVRCSECPWCPSCLRMLSSWRECCGQGFNLGDKSCGSEEQQGKVFLLVHSVFLPHFMPAPGASRPFFHLPIHSDLRLWVKQVFQKEILQEALSYTTCMVEAGRQLWGRLVWAPAEAGTPRAGCWGHPRTSYVL